MPDPEARLAAEMQLVYERSAGVNGDPVTWWQAFAREVLRGLSGRALDRDVSGTRLDIGPAADLALAAAVRRLQTYRSSFTLDWHPNAWLVTVRATPPSKGVADTLDAAINEALR